MIRLAIPLAALCLLAACGSESGTAPADANANAAGDVLEGSISDAMLPLDTVTSQSPPMKIEASDGDGTETSGSEDGSTDETASPPDTSEEGETDSETEAE